MVDREEYPFAFEFLNRVRFREVNFGEQTGTGQPITIAGEEANRPGFVLCAECGTVQKNRSKDNEWRNHALYCSKRKQPDGAEQECVFLYREFGERGHAPVPAGFDVRRVGGVRAVVHRGRADGALRSGSGGRSITCALPGHQHGAGADDAAAVPGHLRQRAGWHGVPKELMRDATPLFEVFKLALAKLNACGCTSDESKDGCYACLYGYHNSHERKHVSRRTAAKLLTEIVGHEAALKPVKTIGEAVTQNHLFDSELERRFIEALRRKAADGSARIEVKEDLVRGKAGYFLKAGAHHWRVEPQVSLGPDQGVVIPSKPDFVLWPETDSGCLPIAVFLDGWQYHKDKIGDDIAKRMAIALVDSASGH